MTWQQELDIRRSREQGDDCRIIQAALRALPKTAIGIAFVFPDRSNRWPSEVIAAIQRNGQ